MKELINKLYNRYLVWRFPFLRPTDRSDYNYRWTYLDDMPIGWKKAFGVKMCKEIKRALVDDDYLDEFEILQVKEKFGGLRFYVGSAPQAVHEIIRRYEDMSYYICCHCGKPATQISTDWICPWCDTCAEEVNKKYNLGKFKPVAEFYGR